MPGAPGAHMFGQYGQFMNDPAAQVAAHFSQTAFKQGQEYLEQNVRLLSPPLLPDSGLQASPY